MKKCIVVCTFLVLVPLTLKFSLCIHPVNIKDLLCAKHCEEFFFFSSHFKYLFGCTGSSLLLLGFLSCGEQGLLSSCDVWRALVVSCGRLLVAVASLVVEHAL